MYIMTAGGEWRPLWSLPQPTLKEVQDNTVWLSSPTKANLAERQAHETQQHLTLLTLREQSDRTRAETLAKPTGIRLTKRRLK
jgi:hypothetical protein